MYLPNTKRNAACFIDILWPNASSNLNLNNLTGIELEVILPGRVERALKSMLDGGLMILSTNGYMKTCYWALMPTEGVFSCYFSIILSDFKRASCFLGFRILLPRKSRPPLKVSSRSVRKLFIRTCSQIRISTLKESKKYWTPPSPLHLKLSRFETRSSPKWITWGKERIVYKSKAIV